MNEQRVIFAAVLVMASIAVASPAWAEKATTALREDWLFQAAGQPLELRTAAEVARAREVAGRILRSSPDLDLSAEWRDLTSLERRLKAERTVGEQFYLAVREVKHRIMLRNPAIDFSSLLLIDQPYPRQPSGMGWPYDKGAGQVARHENSHRNGMMAAPGGKLVVLRGLRPDEFPHGLTKVTANIPWPEVGNGPVDPVESEQFAAPGEFDAFKSPIPIGQQDFLVSAKRKGDPKFRLYLMDVRGNCELLYEGQHNVWHALPVRPRPRPPVQPDRVVWPGTGSQRRDVAPGTFYSADVYEGVPDLPRGMVRSIRVWQQEHTTFSTGGQTFRWSGPGLSIVQEDAAKRILGTAPVHADGSFYVEAPAGKMLYFQLLDEHGRALQTMRSFTGLMPGEHRGCVGCHEQHSTTPAVRRSLALSRPADPLTPPPWGREMVGYERFVQPVLDRYCGKCHQGDGEARQKLDLTLRPAYDFVKEPYLTLVGPAIWVEPRIANLPRPDPSAAGYGLAGIFPVEAFAAEDQLRPIKYHNLPPVRVEALARKYVTIPPRTALSFRSPLVERAMSGKHHGVQVDPVSLQRLIAWVDAFGPYRGLEEVLSLPDPDFAGIEELPIRPRLKNVPQIPRP